MSIVVTDDMLQPQQRFEACGANLTSCLNQSGKFFLCALFSSKKQGQVQDILINFRDTLPLRPGCNMLRSNKNGVTTRETSDCTETLSFRERNFSTHSLRMAPPFSWQQLKFNSIFLWFTRGPSRTNKNGWQTVFAYLNHLVLWCLAYFAINNGCLGHWRCQSLLLKVISKALHSFRLYKKDFFVRVLSDDTCYDRNGNFH